MGVDYSCQTLESEEETLNKIFKDMFKREFNSISIYKNLKNCLILDHSENQLKLNQKLFFSLLDHVLEENQYKEIYRKFMEKIIKTNTDLDCIRKIGLIFIDLSSNKEITKKDLYTKHFFEFYLEGRDENNKKSKKNFIF